MEKWLVYVTLVGALVLFIDGRWRYDVIALAALLFLTLTGVIPHDRAFLGMGHPAVITVAGVLIVSKGLNNGGVVGVLARVLGRVSNGATSLIGVLSLTTAALSAFMNNIGALALVMPVGVRLARKHGHSPSLLLMPLAFGSLLGGLLTVVGTPPNIIIATFRESTGRGAFSTFDFTPVGLGIMVVGMAFIILGGWRLIPQREGRGKRTDFFEIQDYITEVRIREESALVGLHLKDLAELPQINVVILMIIRGQLRIPNPPNNEQFQAGDLLVLETDPNDLKDFIELMKVELVGEDHVQEALEGMGDVMLVEAVVRPNAEILNQTAGTLKLRWQYGVNLLAVSRRGVSIRKRLVNVRFRAGDVLLLQGRASALPDILERLGCLPLAERELQITKPPRLLMAAAVFGAALGLVAFNLLPIQTAIMGAVLVMIVLGLVSLKEAYESVNWPILILLGAMIPVGEALETSGGAQQIAELLLRLGSTLPPVLSLAALIVITTALSNVINNAATAVLMAPIAVSIAHGIGVASDPFLIGVAVGASCAFLTPIGHQSNTLVMGPGGYRFGDYWRMGLPLTALVIVVAVALIPIFWPL